MHMCQLHCLDPCYHFCSCLTHPLWGSFCNKFCPFSLNLLMSFSTSMSWSIQNREVQTRNSRIGFGNLWNIGIPEGEWSIGEIERCKVVRISKSEGIQ